MIDDRLPVAELMAKTGDGDFVRSVAEIVLQIVMEADVDGLIGAGRHERSGERSTWCNPVLGLSKGATATPAWIRGWARST